MESSNFNHLFTFQLSEKVNKDYVPYVNDLIRMIVIQAVIHLLTSLKSGASASGIFFEFIETAIYVSIGVSVYWLVVNKLVRVN